MLDLLGAVSATLQSLLQQSAIPTDKGNASLRPMRWQRVSEMLGLLTQRPDT